MVLVRGPLGDLFGMTAGGLNVGKGQPGWGRREEPCTDEDRDGANVHRS